MQCFKLYACTNIRIRKINVETKHFNIPCALINQRSFHEYSTADLLISTPLVSNKIGPLCLEYVDYWTRFTGTNQTLRVKVNWSLTRTPCIRRPDRRRWGRWGGGLPPYGTRPGACLPCSWSPSVPPLCSHIAWRPLGHYPENILLFLHCQNDKYIELINPNRKTNCKLWNKSIIKISK